MSTVELQLQERIEAAGPELRTISGPGAFGGGFKRFWSLVWLIATTDFRLSYFGSALGYVWSLFRPLLLFAVLYTVFSKVAKIGDDITNYPVLLLMNIMFYNFFSDATNGCVTAIVFRENLVRKMQFPRMVMPIATVLTAFFNLLSAMVVVFAFMLIYGVDPMWTWLLLPVGLAPLVLLSMGIGLLVSALFVRFRDVQPIWAVFSTALFYASPVLYTIDNVNDEVKSVLQHNPLTGILEMLRKWMVDPEAPGGITALGGYSSAIVPVLSCIVIIVLGVVVFNRESKRAAEML